MLPAVKEKGGRKARGLEGGLVEFVPPGGARGRGEGEGWRQNAEILGCGEVVAA